MSASLEKGVKEAARGGAGVQRKQLCERQRSPTRCGNAAGGEENVQEQLSPGSNLLQVASEHTCSVCFWDGEGGVWYTLVWKPLSQIFLK